MTEPTYTHCLFCSLCCPIRIDNRRGERFSLDYEIGRAKAAQGLCGRGSSWVELIEHPRRLQGGLLKQGERSVPISAPEAGEAFTRVMGQALGQGRVALLADGNLPCEELLALHHWADAQEGRAEMAVYLPPPDLDLLEGLSIAAVPTVSPEELDRYDGVLVIGNALQTHPVLGRPLLEKKFKNPRALFAVVDTLRSATTRFSTVWLDIPPEAHQAVLEKLLAALEVSITLDESPLLAQLAEAAGVSYGRVKRLVSQLQAARKVAVVVSAELGKNSDWRSVGVLAGRLAHAKAGAVLPLCSYGNAMGAYRVMRNLGLGSLGNLLEAGHQSWAAVVQVGCDLGNTFPDQLLEPLLGPSVRKVVFSSLRTPSVDQADLAVAIPTPVEYSGTVIAASGKECHMKAPARVPPGIQNVGDFFRRQMGQRRGEMNEESAWKGIPPRAQEVPAATPRVPAAPGEGRPRLQAVAGPIHFDDGALTRAASWTGYWQAEPVVSMSSALAGQLGLTDGGKVVLKQNGRRLELACRIDPVLEAGQVTVAAHFPEVRKFLPWRWDESGARLYCPAAIVELEPQKEQGIA